MPTQEIINNAIKWFRNNDIESFQDDTSSVYVCVKGYYMQVSNAEIEYRSELCIEQFKTYPYDKAI